MESVPVPLQWLPGFEIDDDPLHINNYDMSSLDDISPQELVDHPFVVDNLHYHSSESYASYCTSFAPPNLVDDVERPAKVHKSVAAPSYSPPSGFNTLLDFSAPAAALADDGGNGRKGKNRSSSVADIAEAPAGSLNKGGSATRSPSHATEHIIAERKRREKLCQRFIALSAVLPDLKKMDKASVLQDATEHVKQLQERVKSLEEQAAKTTAESVVIVKQSHLLPEEDAASSTRDENFEDRFPTPTMTEPFPGIEAKVSGRTVLLRVHCDRRKGLLVALLSKVESLGLAVTSTSVLPFAGAATDITIISQMEESFSMTVEDIVKNLNLAFNRMC